MVRETASIRSSRTRQFRVKAGEGFIGLGESIPHPILKKALRPGMPDGSFQEVELASYRGKLPWPSPL